MSASITPLSAVGSRRAGQDDAIYQRLYAAIVEQQLLPGTRLPEDTLADAFGVSRTGIRKVLQRLAHERLIEVQPNRGASVAQPSVQEAREVFAARRVIECAAMPLIAAATTPAGLDVLCELVTREHAALAAGERAVAIVLSGQFHVQLLALTGNEPLVDFLAQLVSRTSLIIALYGSPATSGCGHSEHEELLALLARGEADAAERWMEQHLLEIEHGLALVEPIDDEPDLKRLFTELAQRPLRER